METLQSYSVKDIQVLVEETFSGVLVEDQGVFFTKDKNVRIL